MSEGALELEATPAGAAPDTPTPDRSEGMHAAGGAVVPPAQPETRLGGGAAGLRALTEAVAAACSDLCSFFAGGCCRLLPNLFIRLPPLPPLPPPAAAAPKGAARKRLLPPLAGPAAAAAPVPGPGRSDDARCCWPRACSCAEAAVAAAAPPPPAAAAAPGAALGSCLRAPLLLKSAGAMLLLWLLVMGSPALRAEAGAAPALSPAGVSALPLLGAAGADVAAGAGLCPPKEGMLRRAAGAMRLRSEPLGAAAAGTDGAGLAAAAAAVSWPDAPAWPMAAAPVPVVGSLKTRPAGLRCTVPAQVDGLAAAAAVGSG